MKVVKYNDTKLYVNSLIPFPGFLAIQLFGMIFYRKSDEKYLQNEMYADKIMEMINHENIHKEQIKDFCLPLFWFRPLQMLIGGLMFYLIYILEWFFRLFINGPSKAYSNISFEKEAYENESDFEYIKKKRKHFGQWKKKKGA